MLTSRTAFLLFLLYLISIPAQLQPREYDLCRTSDPRADRCSIVTHRSDTETATPMPGVDAIRRVMSVSDGVVVLPIYSEPSLESSVLEAAIRGVELTAIGEPVTANGEKWIRVVSIQGIEGWVPEMLEGVRTLETQASGEGLIVWGSTEILSIHTEPDSAAQILEVVVSGTELLPLGSTVMPGGMRWWRVQSPSGTEGWVVDELEDQKTLIAAPVATPTPFPTQLATDALSNNLNAVAEELCDGKTTTFQIGETVLSDVNGLRILNDVRGNATQTLAQAYAGNRLLILDGPVCSNAIQYGERVWYWYISLQLRNGEEIIGWIAEGIRGNQFVCPLSEPDCY